MRLASSLAPFEPAPTISTSGSPGECSKYSLAESVPSLAASGIRPRLSRRRLADSTTPLLTEDLFGEDMAGKGDIFAATTSKDDDWRENEDAVESALAKRVLRKIDMRLIPLLFVTYNLNFMDKTILSSASVFGLKDSTVMRS